MSEKKSVVVIGGGTGIYPVLQGLKEYQDIDITAVISAADSGGSTGRLRDEFGQLPMGDMRQALTALASEVDGHEQLLRELFLYRFNKGEGLDGHNFGNLLLVALCEITGSEIEAVRAAAQVLRVRGQVLPVTEDQVHIVAEYDDGVLVKGEHDIDEPQDGYYEKQVVNFYAEPAGTIAPDVQEAIVAADLVLLGPGDLYASLLANCVVGGVAEAIQETEAPLVFAVNLMTRPGQTHGMTAADHVQAVEKYVGKMPDCVIVNTSEVPESLLTRYAELGQYPVVDDTDRLDCKVIKADLLSDEEVVKKKGDVLVRSLVRGDAAKTAAVIKSLLE